LRLTEAAQVVSAGKSGKDAMSHLTEGNSMSKKTLIRIAAGAASGLLLLGMTEASLAIGPPPGSHRPPAPPPPIINYPHPAPPPSSGYLPNGSNSGLRSR
jgi:hypothetical protein